MDGPLNDPVRTERVHHRVGDPVGLLLEPVTGRADLEFGLDELTVGMVAQRSLQSQLRGAGCIGSFSRQVPTMGLLPTGCLAGKLPAGAA